MSLRHFSEVKFFILQLSWPRNPHQLAARPTGSVSRTRDRERVPEPVCVLVGVADDTFAAHGGGCVDTKDAGCSHHSKQLKDIFTASHWPIEQDAIGYLNLDPSIAPRRLGT